MNTVQCTINGKDSGGYIWQNVFHLTGDDTGEDETTASYLSDAAAAMQSALEDPMSNAKAATNVILSYQTKLIVPVTSFTFTRLANVPGQRESAESVGALGGKLIMYPNSGFTTGRMFINGCLETDFTADIISDTYKTLMDAIATALETFNGSDVDHHWQLVLLHKKTGNTSPVNDVETQITPGILGKRVRN